MTDKDLRHLRRADLIEIIYELRKSEESLQAENAALKERLTDRQLKFERAGSLAELSASLNGLFEAAQATAEQYLEALRAAAPEPEAPEAVPEEPEPPAEPETGVPEQPAAPEPAPEETEPISPEDLTRRYDAVMEDTDDAR